MIIYGKILNKAIELSDKELLEKMWFKEKNGVKLNTNLRTGYSGGGIDEFDLLADIPHIDTPSLALSRGGGGFDERWDSSQLIFRPHPHDTSLFFEIPNWEHRDEIEFYTWYVDILTIDIRAFYIMVIEVMKQAGGKISEDDKKTWLTLEEFETRHQDILSMTFDEANEISLKEALTLPVVQERAPDSMTEEEYNYRGWEWDQELFEDIWPDLKEKRLRKEKREG